MSHAIVDMDTGEILDNLPKSYKILTEGQLEFSKKKAAQLDTSDGRQFYKVYPLHLYNMLDNVKASTALLAIALISFVSYDTNRLEFNNGTIIKNHHIVKITRHTKRFVSEAMRELVDNQILAKVTVGTSYEYYGNPFLFLIGDKVNKSTCDMFRGYK